ncbi:MAG: hypothetical protein ONB45_17205 [candidate division KSB1 bacterium]|nr:hypothetical protein [candidate division KSB1 bacterium]
MSETALAQPETIYMSVRSSRKTRLGVSDNPTIGLFVSRNAGTTWEHKGWRDQIKVFYTEAGANGTIWSACGNGVLRSTDAGATWKITTGWEVTEALKVRVDSSHSATVYAATAYGIFKTTDGGRTWQEKNRGLRNTFVSDLVIDRANCARLLAATEDGIYVSTHRGERWALAGLKGKGIRTIVQDPTRAKIFWAGTEDDGVFRSDDGGETWQPFNHGAQLVTVYTIAIDPKNPDTIYLGTHEGGVYRSDDGGKSWQQKITGLKNLVVHALAILPSNPKIVFAGTINGGLYRSTDGGETWEFNSQEDGQVWGLSVR